TAAGTSWTNLSDQRFKKNITPISFALDMVDKLQGVNFDWRVGEFKDRDFPTGKQIGFIAQEVEKVLPEVVTTDHDGYKGVEYSNITAVLVEAVKELKKENDVLKIRIENLEKK
ncbi:MAG: tail fiber domain-containing protein, partial [Candidatus Gracilibacteria bacterium]|nr:tail fiber domain-containing protein [Candidatus Gracilibacteria bacterium]